MHLARTEMWVTNSVTTFQRHRYLSRNADREEELAPCLRFGSGVEPTFEAATCLAGQVPSHGIDPSLNRAAMSWSYSATSLAAHRSKDLIIAVRSLSRNSGLMSPSKLRAVSDILLSLSSELKVDPGIPEQCCSSDRLTTTTIRKLVPRCVSVWIVIV